MRRYTHAVTAYKNAIAIEPEFADAYANLGAAYTGLKNYSMAIEALDKAIALKPESKMADRAQHLLMRLLEQ